MAIPGPIGRYIEPREPVGKDKLERLLDELERKLGTRRAAIPAQYHRSFESRPFENCDFCRQPLLPAGKPYMIIKYFADRELQQEMALCSQTMAQLKAGYSEHSLKATGDFFAIEAMERHRAEIASAGELVAENFTDRCWRCSDSRQSISQWFDYAYCDGQEMLYRVYPYMQCGKCTLDLTRMLSEHTLEFRGRFFAEHFGLPPDLHSREPAEREYVEVPVWGVAGG